MIIHIWMHWFWITTAFFKGLPFFAVQMISFSCFSYTSAAEAGLLLNQTFINQTYSLNEKTNSSQIDSESNITSLPISENHPPLEITTHRSPASSPLSVTTAQNPDEESSIEHEDTSKIVSEPTSDVKDTYNGGVDLFQYPLKKLTKYSHIKYGKLKTKGKSEETTGEEKKVETVKIVEEKININFSAIGDTLDTADKSIDKVNVNTSERNASEIDLIPTTIAKDSVTEEINSSRTESPNVTFTSSTEDVTKVEPVEIKNITQFPSTAIPDLFSNSTEDQKDPIIKNESLMIENKVEESRAFTTVEPFIVKNLVAAATSAHNFEEERPGLNAGSITGITLGILVIFSLFGAVSFVLYRRRYLNKPQVLHDKCSNLDSSGYIDDTSLRENSEEMYSLDNDSFLNSLEAMTIQNYWTENVKHTKL